MNKEEFKRIFDREVVKQMRDNMVPGMSVLITKDGETYYDRSFGTREWEGSKPANSDTLYGIASMTKSMTSLAILQLHEQGKLSIEDPIADHIPVDLDKYPGQPIKIKHLMAHASGIPNLGSYAAQIKNENLTTFNTTHLPMGNWDDFYFHINDASDWIIAPPGEKFYYNNDAYTMLSRIITAVSGMKYEKYVNKYIFRPLKMDRSTYSREELEADDNHAKGYSTDPTEKGMERKPKRHMSGKFQSGAGGLNSTAKELTRYITMQMKGGKLDGQRVLSEELIREMQSPQNTNIMGENLYMLSREESYGYGLSISKFAGYTLIQHGGASGVSGGVVAFVPELNLTYTHLFNVGWFSSHLLHMAILAIAGKDPHTELPLLVRRDHFKLLTGEYVNYRRSMELKVTFENGLLHVEQDVISKTKFSVVQVNHEEIKPLQFWIYSPAGRSKIIFTISEDEKIMLEIERNLFKKVTYKEELE